ncbi:J domain-containing protein [Thiovibrio sp. JS02]
MTCAMEAVAAEKELFRACEIIFGPDLQISREFLEYLQLSGIKSAYRQRAMETHPDRVASQTAQHQQKSHDLFLSVQEAYENLLTFLDAREKGYRLPPEPRPFAARPTASPRPARPQARAKQRSPRPEPADSDCKTKTTFSSGSRQQNVFWDIDSLYQGPLPNRRLLLGHFLYYSGLINWRTIIQALIWQRTERPRLGELGQRFGMLNEEEVLHILRNRPTAQPFGKTALDLGLLSEPQLQMLIFHQKRLQKKFGEFFLKKEILAPEELRELLTRYQEHNANIARRTQGGRFSF